MKKYYKIIDVTKKLLCDLPCDVLLRIFTSFVRAITNYCDIIYDKPTNESFKIN